MKIDGYLKQKRGTNTPFATKAILKTFIAKTDRRAIFKSSRRLWTSTVQREF